MCRLESAPGRLRFSINFDVRIEWSHKDRLQINPRAFPCPSRLPQFFSPASADDLIILAVVADPKPYDIVPILNRHRPIMDTNARRPIAAYFLEMQRGMTRIAFEQPKIFVREPLNVFGKFLPEAPELWTRAMLHRSLQRPSRKPCRASSARVSSRPA